MSWNIADRRRFVRHDCDCGVKVYDPVSRRYRPGRMINHSAAGALIEMAGPIHSRAGQTLALAVDYSGASGLMSHGDLVPVTIVRHTGDKLAVQFTSKIALPMAA